MKSVSKFIVCLITCFAAGGIGGLFTKISVSGWYAQLIKPEFSPPNWVFAP
ncbi:MAG: TspO/MBR family protein, partial [Firmicutes bacterium]|nr:TspO/MBR family protein [Bacillota bacterium]